MLVVLLPGMGAGYAAFLTEIPTEYQPYCMALGGFLAYLSKNYIQNKD